MFKLLFRLRTYSLVGVKVFGLGGELKAGAGGIDLPQRQMQGPGAEAPPFRAAIFSGLKPAAPSTKAKSRSFPFTSLGVRMTGLRGGWTFQVEWLE